MFLYSQAFSREPLREGEKKYYDHKIDVYSFALVLWELLTNRQPFSGVPHILVPYFVSKVKVTKSTMLFYSRKYISLDFENVGSYFSYRTRGQA